MLTHAMGNNGLDVTKLFDDDLSTIKVIMLLRTVFGRFTAEHFLQRCYLTSVTV